MKEKIIIIYKSSFTYTYLYLLIKWKVAVCEFLIQKRAYSYGKEMKKKSQEKKLIMFGIGNVIIYVSYIRYHIIIT